MALTIRSNDSDATLTVTADGPDYWRAELAVPGLRAFTRLYELSIGSVGEFLAGLAKAWRGWDGERSWESLEGDLRLAATHDGRGTVTLGVTLRTDNLGPGGWHAEAPLSLDAGGLDRLAREASALRAQPRR